MRQERPELACSLWRVFPCFADYPKAIDYARRAYKADSGSYEATFLLSVVLSMRNEMWQEAMEYLEKARKIKDDDEIDEMAVKTLFKAGQYDSCMKLCKNTYQQTEFVICTKSTGDNRQNKADEDGETSVFTCFLFFRIWLIYRSATGRKEVQPGDKTKLHRLKRPWKN